MAFFKSKMLTKNSCVHMFHIIFYWLLACFTHAMYVIIGCNAYDQSYGTPAYDVVFKLGLLWLVLCSMYRYYMFSAILCPINSIKSLSHWLLNQLQCITTIWLYFSDTSHTYIGWVSLKSVPGQLYSCVRMMQAMLQEKLLLLLVECWADCRL